MTIAMDKKTLKDDEFSIALTPNAEAVLRSRYLRKNAEGEVIETALDLFTRVADTVASAERAFGLSDGAVETIRDEFLAMMLEGRFMPNSPTLMNAGRESGMLSACFVLPVEDSIDGIFSAVKNTALIQKAGGGTGFSFSRLRPRGDRVASSGGTTSGPISFMKVFSQTTAAIQQGAFRRGANMGIMRIDHPDVIDFVNAKQDLNQLTNFNLSVAVTDSFMEALEADPDGDHVVRNPRTNEEAPLVKEDGTHWSVSEIFDLVATRAWETGEPGVIFIDRMNAANPTPHVGEICATNPCGEQPLLAYESCNLGSINVANFVMEADEGSEIDYDALGEVVHLATRFLDDVIEVNSYPIPEIETMSRGNRKIGLGIMGFADMLFKLGIPYSSEEGVAKGEELMEFINKESHRASEKLAEQRGMFPNWKGSVWQERRRPIRNACTTTVAPTGTVSIIADCSGGIEPLFSLVYFRNVLDGTKLMEVNKVFESVARERGFYTGDLMKGISERGSIQSIDGIPDDVKEVFLSAHDISPEWHVRMQAAFQKHCDASISKTINFKKEATIDDVSAVYSQAFEQGCKGITMYRDGCRKNQPMSLSSEKKSELAQEHGDMVKPMVMPEIMPAVSVKQITPFGNMHVKIVVDPSDGREREVFAQLAKCGDLANSDLEAICRLISLYLRVNGSLRDVVSQLDGIGSSLTIPTKEGRISSLADGLARAIHKYWRAKEDTDMFRFLAGKKKSVSDQGHQPMGFASRASTVDDFKIKCPTCSAELVFEEGCCKCRCGFSQC